MQKQNEKMDEALSLSLQLSDTERELAGALGFGYEEETDRFRVIVKYVGELNVLREDFPDVRITQLLNQYAIITAGAAQLSEIAAMPEIVYMEKPKRLSFNEGTGQCSFSRNPAAASLRASEVGALTGEGVLVAIIDSGIDYFHPAFRDAAGNSRIAYLWDQTADGSGLAERVPIDYGYGTQYSMQDINEALHAGSREDGLRIVPESDRTGGHGTAVAGVAAGNGAGSSGNRYRGVAPSSTLLVVKLGREEDYFAGTTEVMEGIDYVLRKAIELQKPVAVNLSFGTNDGAHDGDSLFERYIADLNGVWKNVIVAASGNEGNAGHHAFVRLKRIEETVSFAVGQYEKNISLQIWKQYMDAFSIQLETPSGSVIPIVPGEGKAASYHTVEGELLVLYGEPGPYRITQEIWLACFTRETGGFIGEGIWQIHFIPEKIKSGAVHLWLPTIETVEQSTGFLQPEPDTTLTLPSTARNILCAGAYNAASDGIAVFSGRGNTADGRIAPTFVAPGVDVMAAAPGGGYNAYTGTSFAAPFVTGSAALWMEWGIVQGNDPYLYGEKVKAYLMKDAKQLPGQTALPSVTEGYGALRIP